ncbi:hypothetical protein OH146_13580 [Salinibacterium sp. SYSU T00001]|uniref:hypothetical protein n=1 Tax=Homoserinimonas sedimenticola TaxID=2986805 RepID=UPI002235B618|nr:hypothetical protein [Salinibacterium sedimenticola]MCW4386806.1 hypothetical protein [Salinibacterium sedimenticola]
MEEKPDVSRGTGEADRAGSEGSAPSAFSAGTPGGELRRDRRRLREAARAEAEVDPSVDGGPASDFREASGPSGDTPRPETGGFSAFEALGFDRETFGAAAASAPASVTPESGLPAASITPPQSFGVAPPVYGTPGVSVHDEVAGLPVGDVEPSPPPLLEPPRPDPSPATQAFSTSSLQTSGLLASDAGVAGADAASPFAPPASPDTPPTRAFDAAQPAEPWVPEPLASEPLAPESRAAEPLTPEPLTPEPASPEPSPLSTSSPWSTDEGDSDAAATTAFATQFPASASSAASPAADRSAPPAPHVGGAAPGSRPEGGHPVLGPLAPRVREVPGDLRIIDIAAIVLAFLLPPVGFVVALVAMARGRDFRGWPSPLARAATWVAVVMTFVMAVAGAFLWFELEEQREAQAAADAAAAAHAAVVAESEEFCATLAATPTIFGTGDPDYGWPQLEDPAGYVPAISAYAATWQGLVPVAPSGIAEQVTSFSARVDGIVAVANSLPSPNRAGDLLDLHSQADIATIDGFVAEYCSPEISGE